jgi:hypothetical protein
MKKEKKEYTECKYYIYWENKDDQETPELVKSCINIFNKKCKNVVLLTNQNITDYINVVCTKNIKNIAQKADYYRAKILYTYGGIWCDIDTIMLKDLNEEWNDFNISEKEICISTSEINNAIPTVCIAYLMAKKNNIIFKKWTEECEKIIKSNKRLKWADLGGHLLGKIILQNNFADLIYSFSNKITYRYGWKNYLKYYITNEETIKKEKEKIKNYKIIILYGTYMYNKNIPNNSVLNMFLNY